MGDSFLYGGVYVAEHGGFEGVFESFTNELGSNKDSAGGIVEADEYGVDGESISIVQNACISGRDNLYIVYFVREYVIP